MGQILGLPSRQRPIPNSLKQLPNTCFSRKIVSLFHHDLTSTLQISLTLPKTTPPFYSFPFLHPFREIYISPFPTILPKLAWFYGSNLTLLSLYFSTSQLFTTPKPKIFCF